jgi:L-lactate dehydrogenase (cytochrome)
MGKEGVTLALEIIRKELDMSMALCGKRDIKAVDRGIIAEIQ